MESTCAGISKKGNQPIQIKHNMKINTNLNYQPIEISMVFKDK